MRVGLAAIGNSRGIRIPKPLIDQCGFGDTVEMRIESGCLVIAPDRRPRDGWEQAFRSAGPALNDELLFDPAPPNEFDHEEWRW
ncbi:MAG: AbrB/MazE/SpoVT family DNA-binding domain-containing protein [Bryobacteraceae bacterium]|jgi:antitoxin MazE